MGTVDATVGDAAGPDQHAIAGPTREVAVAAHRPVVLPLWASKLQPQPEPRGKVRDSQEADERHLVGAGQEDLHAHMKTHLAVRAGRQTGPCHASRKSSTAATQGAPATAVRGRATSLCFVCKNRVE